MQCLKCEFEQADGTLVCPNCGGVHAKLQALVSQGQVIRSVKVPTLEERERARVAAQAEAIQTSAQALRQARLTGHWAGIEPAVVRAEAAAVVLATLSEIPGRSVDAVAGVVTADHAYAFALIGEAINEIGRTVIGAGKSEKMMRLLDEGRAQVMGKLRFKALDCGANAVLGLHFDYEEFSGATQLGTIVIIGTGTAVRLLPDSRA